MQEKSHFISQFQNHSMYSPVSGRTIGVVRRQGTLTVIQFKSLLDQSEIDCSQLYVNERPLEVKTNYTMVHFF